MVVLVGGATCCLCRSLPFHFISCFSFQLNSIQPNSIQFDSIQFNSIQFNSIQFNSLGNQVTVGLLLINVWMLWRSPMWQDSQQPGPLLLCLLAAPMLLANPIVNLLEDETKACGVLCAVAVCCVCCCGVCGLCCCACCVALSCAK
jgi:hypothetical protein